MSNDLVVQLGAKLDQFQNDMTRAGDMADSAVSRIESSFANANPGLNFSALGVALAGAGVAIVGVIGLVAALNKNLAEMAATAERVGLSFERFQQLKFGANALGITDTDFSSSLESFVTKLQNAKFVSNDLLRVFQANKIEIKDANGKLKDTNDLLTKAFDIIKRSPTLQDALQIGSFLGLSKEFSQKIFDAGDNFLRLAATANAAGAVIDDATINKAKDFDREWTKAAALWSANLRAALGDVLPLLNQAVNGAVAVVQSVKGVFDAISAIKDFAFAPNIDTASLNQLNSLLKQYEGIKTTLESGQPLNPVQLFQGANIQVDGKITAESAQAAIDVIKAKVAAFNNDPKTKIVINPNPSVNPGPKPKTDGRDQFEVTVDSIVKRTAILNADTAATFQNNAVQAQFRAEFQLLTAIMRDNGEVTQAQIDIYERLRQSMTAQNALTAAGITLTGDHAAKFIAASEGIKTATVAYDLARDTLNKINSASQQIGSALSTAFADAIVEGKNLNDVFNSLLKTLEKAAINSVFTSIFNPTVAGGPSPFASLFKGIIPGFASGTDFAPGGAAWVGEHGRELINLPRGAQVVPNAVSSRGGGGIVVNLIEDSSRAGQTQKQDNNNGGFDLTLFVDAITAKNAANPGSATSAVLNQRGRIASR